MTIDTAKLKAAAEKARWGDWSAYKPHSGARGYEVRVGSEAVAQHCLKDDAAFIAEAGPKVVLELIAALEDAEKRVDEIEALRKERELAVPVAWVPQCQLNLLKKSVIVEADLSSMQRFDEVPIYTTPPAQPVAVPDAKPATCKYCAGSGYYRLQRSYNTAPCPCRHCTELAAPGKEG